MIGRNFFQKISEAMRSLSGHRETPAQDCQILSILESAEQRRRTRHEDGSATEVRTSHGDAIAARIVDLNSFGVRLWVDGVLEVGSRVSCLVHFGSRSVPLGVRVLWRRSQSNGFEYGMSFAPVVPGTEYVLDNYLQHVLSRRAA